LSFFTLESSLVSGQLTGLLLLLTGNLPFGRALTADGSADVPLDVAEAPTATAGRSCALRGLLDRTLEAPGDAVKPLLDPGDEGLYVLFCPSQVQLEIVSELFRRDGDYSLWYEEKPLLPRLRNERARAEVCPREGESAGLLLIQLNEADRRQGL
jgi:hypothetical protein